MAFSENHHVIFLGDQDPWTICKAGHGLTTKELIHENRQQQPDLLRDSSFSFWNHGWTQLNLDDFLVPKGTFGTCCIFTRSLSEGTAVFIIDLLSTRSCCHLRQNSVRHVRTRFRHILNQEAQPKNYSSECIGVFHTRMIYNGHYRTLGIT